jgi:hypothetical protein
MLNVPVIALLVQVGQAVQVSLTLPNLLTLHLPWVESMAVQELTAQEVDVQLKSVMVPSLAHCCYNVKS